MDVTPLVPKGRQLIESYGDGGFRISGRFYEGSVLVLPGETLAWPVTDVASLAEEHFHLLLQGVEGENPEIVLLGMGAAFAPVPAPLRAWFRSRRIGLEAMDTGAACRTYNILMAEGRRVAAALVAA